MASTNPYENPGTGGRAPRYQVAVVAPRKDRQNVPGEPDRWIIPPLDPTWPVILWPQKPFTDHTGHGALSIYRGYKLPAKPEPALLPPWSWQIYVTYGATAADCGDLPFALYKSLINQMSRVELQWFRFDFVFLPGADSRACVRHYLEEKRARAGEELALVPSYMGVGGGARWENAMVVWNHEDWKRDGLEWVVFDGEPEGKKIVEKVRSMNKEYVPERDWVGDSMDEVMRHCTTKRELEREFMVKKERIGY